MLLSNAKKLSIADSISDANSSRLWSVLMARRCARARAAAVEIERATGMFEDAKPLAGGLMSRHSPFKCDRREPSPVYHLGWLFTPT